MNRRVGSARPHLLLVFVLALLGSVLAGTTTAGAAPSGPVSPHAQSFPLDTGVDLPYDAADRSYRAVAPTRLLDTRRVGAPIGPNGYGDVDVTGRAGIPLGSVGAVALNVTAVAPTAPGYLSLWASTVFRPAVSDVNFARGQTVANAVFVELDDTGTLDIHNASGGAVDVLVDVVGYVLGGTASAPGSLEPTVPTRVLDTRSGLGAPRVAVAPGGTARVAVAGADGLPASALAAVALNVTATAPSAAGYVTAWPDGTPRPRTSSLNFAAGQTVANLVVVPVGPGGVVDLFNGSAGSVQLVADVETYSLRGTPSADGTVDAATPTRVLDTRVGIGAPRAAVAPGATVHLTVAGRHDLPGEGGSALLTLTATASTADGYLTAWSSDTERPVVSSLNFSRGHTVANAVAVSIGEAGTINLYNGSSGTVQLVADLTGRLLGKDRSVVDARPVAGTVTATAAQVLASSTGADGSTTVTLASDLAAPAVGAGLVVPESAAAPVGVVGTATSVTRGADGTSTVVTTPVTLSALYPELDVSVNRSLLASDVVDMPGVPAGTTVFGGLTGNFSCTGTETTRTFRVGLDLSRLHVDVAIDARQQSVHAQISGSPYANLHAAVGGASRCVLSNATAGDLSVSLHIPVTSTPPVYLDASPTVTVTSDGAASLDWSFYPHFAMGFDRGNGHDSNTRDLSGSPTASATGAATVDIGLTASLTVAGRAAFAGSFGPSLTSADRGLGCSSEHAVLAETWTGAPGVLLPARTAPGSGRFAAGYLRGCDWDEFPLLVAPGRVGNVRSGTSVAAVTAAAGVPLRVTTTGTCRTSATTDNRDDVKAYLDPSGARARTLFSYRWVTKEGARTGSTWAQIHATYPATQLVRNTYDFDTSTFIDGTDGTSLRISFGTDLRATFAYAGSRADVRATPFC